MQWLIAVVIAVAAYFVWPKGLQASVAPKSVGWSMDYIRNSVHYAASKFGVPDAIVLAIIKRESDFDPGIVNTKDPNGGAWGLMQLRKPALQDYNDFYGTAYELDDLLKPDLNVLVGTWYVSRFIKKYGLSVGVEIYNVGETGYNRDGKRNSGYRIAVMQNYDVFSA